jgi:hypothetical protein
MVMSRQFRLAPMDGLNRVLTIVVGVVMLPALAPMIGLPVILLASGAPTGVGLIVGGISLVLGAAIGLGLAAIPLYARPRRFELDTDGLRVVWPIRSKLVPWGEIALVEQVSSGEFRDRYGWGMRIGAGGFLGGFGWLSTSKQTFHLYISRVDYAVLVHLKNDKPWRITPESPEEFVRDARAFLGPAAAEGSLTASSGLAAPGAIEGGASSRGGPGSRAWIVGVVAAVLVLFLAVVGGVVALVVYSETRPPGIASRGYRPPPVLLPALPTTPASRPARRLPPPPAPPSRSAGVAPPARPADLTPPARPADLAPPARRAPPGGELRDPWGPPRTLHLKTPGPKRRPAASYSPTKPGGSELVNPW